MIKIVFVNVKRSEKFFVSEASLVPTVDRSWCSFPFEYSDDWYYGCSQLSDEDYFVKCLADVHGTKVLQNCRTGGNFIQVVASTRLILARVLSLNLSLGHIDYGADNMVLQQKINLCVKHES